MGFSSGVHGNQAAGAGEAKLWSVKAIGPTALTAGDQKTGQNSETRDIPATTIGHPQRTRPKYTYTV